MKALGLVVLNNGPSKSMKMVQVGADVPQITYKVKLNPDKKHYDLLHRTFGPPLPLRSYKEKEVESIRVELTSTAPQWYDLQLIIEWYDVENPNKIKVLKSSIMCVDFPRVGSDTDR